MDVGDGGFGEAEPRPSLVATTGDSGERELRRRDFLGANWIGEGGVKLSSVTRVSVRKMD